MDRGEVPLALTRYRYAAFSYPGAAWMPGDCSSSSNTTKASAPTATATIRPIANGSLIDEQRHEERQQRREVGKLVSRRPVQEQVTTGIGGIRGAPYLPTTVVNVTDDGEHRGPVDHGGGVICDRLASCGG